MSFRQSWYGASNCQRPRILQCIWRNAFNRLYKYCCLFFKVAHSRMTSGRKAHIIIKLIATCLTKWRMESVIGKRLNYIPAESPVDLNSSKADWSLWLVMYFEVFIRWLLALVLNILLNHFIGYIARTDRKITPCPNMLPPKLHYDFGEFMKQLPGCFTFQIQRYFCYWQPWWIANQQLGRRAVNMIFWYMPLNNLNLIG